MQVQCFQFSQRVPYPRALVWRFFSDPANLAVLTPPGAGFEAGMGEGPVFPGQVLTHRVKVLPCVKLTWVSEILQVNDGHSFVDGQEAGPFRFWRHRHVFREIPGGTVVEDTVHWALPFDPFSRLARPFVRKQLESLFAYREQALPGALAQFGSGSRGEPPVRPD